MRSLQNSSGSCLIEGVQQPKSAGQEADSARLSGRPRLPAYRKPTTPTDTESGNSIMTADPLPTWVTLGAHVVELSETRGIVLSRTRIKSITDTAIELRCGTRYLLRTMQPADRPEEVIFSRPNTLIPGIRTRLASPDHPEARH